MKKYRKSLTGSIIFVILLLGIGATAILYGVEYYNTESTLSELTEDVDSLNIVNTIADVEPYQNQDLDDYQYRIIEMNNTDYIVKMDKPQLSKIIFIVLIPFSIAIIASMILIRSHEKEVSKKHLEPLSNLLKHLESVLSGNTDELDEEVINDFKEQITRLGGNPDILLDSYISVAENQKIRRDFTANVTHELKSPLTSINGYAEMIASGMTDDEDTKRFANIIHKEGVRLLSMINEIIQLSKFDSVAIKESDISEFDLLPLIENINVSMGGYARDRNVKVNIYGENVVVNGNKTLLEESIRNLVSNGIKYSKEKGGKLDIYIEQDDDNIYIKFKDDGVGIKEENIPRIFERFYVENESRGRGAGTGLGLSLVKHIAESHFGSIGVESKEGVGSIFTLRLPKDISGLIEREIIDNEN